MSRSGKATLSDDTISTGSTGSRSFAKHINVQRSNREVRAEVALSLSARQEKAKAKAQAETRAQSKAEGSPQELSKAEQLRSNIEISLKRGNWSSQAAFLNVTPPKYEALLTKGEISAIMSSAKESTKKMFYFPDDDWKIKKAPPKFRTVDLPLPDVIKKSEGEADIPLELKQCAKSYVSNTYVVDRKYAKFTQTEKTPLAPTRDQQSKNTYACDMPIMMPSPAHSKRSSSVSNRNSMISRQMSSADADELGESADIMENVKWMLAWVPDEKIAKRKNVTPAKHRDDRNKDRIPLLSKLDSMSHKSRPFSLDRVGAVQPISEIQAASVRRFSVQCDPMNIPAVTECCDLLYGSLCLYDVKREKKVSEMFYFNLTSDDSLKKLLSANVQDGKELNRAMAQAKKRDSKISKLVEGIVTPDGDSLNGLLPMDQASIDSDVATIALSEANPKMIDDPAGRHKIEAAAMRQLIRNYRRTGSSIASAVMELDKIVVHSSAELREQAASIVLMLRVEKVLEGDPSKVLDLYSKSSDQLDSRKLDEQMKQRRETLSRFSRRLGEFRMPFAWGAIPLEEAASLQTIDLELYQESAEKHDDDELFRNLNDLARKPQDRTVIKKMKKLSNTLRIRIRELDEAEALPRTLTPNLFRIQPWEENDGPVALEVRHLPAQPKHVSHTSYRHDIFVYPKSVSFEKFRNIAVKVEFFDMQILPTHSGHDKSTKGLPVIYNRKLLSEKSESITTPVTYHVKNPSFHEEIKMALPEKLTPTSHLLFTFYHVRCKEKAKKEKSAVDVIGYAWHALVNPMARIQTGENIELNVAQDLPGSYLLKEGASKAKYVDSKKAVFVMSVKLDSTVLSDDLMVQGFMLNTKEYLRPGLADNNSINLATGVRNLKDANSLALIQFLPFIASQLLGILRLNTNRGHVLVQETFTALCHLVATAQQHTKGEPSKRSPELAAFVKYQHHVYGFNGDSTSTKSSGLLHEELVNWLLIAVTDYASRQEPWAQKSHKVCVLNTWFFLELIVKSLAQYIELEEKRVQSGNKPRSGLLPAKFLADLRIMLLGLVQCVITEDSAAHAAIRASLPANWTNRLIASVGFTLRDILSYIDRTVAIGIIHDVFKLLHCGKKVDQFASHRIDILEIICSHEHYIPLNLPIDLPKKAKIAEEVNDEFMNMHFFVGLLLSEVKSMLYSDNGSVRGEALQLLGRILSSHDSDNRYQDPSSRYQIYKLYFPIITIILEYSEHCIFTVPQTSEGVVETGQIAGAASTASIRLSESESVDIIAIFLHVICRNKTATFREWLKNRVPQTKKSVLYLVRLGVNGMQYPGKKFLLTKLQYGNSGAAAAKATKNLEVLEGFYTGGKTGVTNERMARRRIEKAESGASKAGPNRDSDTNSALSRSVTAGQSLREARSSSVSTSKRPNTNFKSESVVSASNFRKEPDTNELESAKPLIRYSSKSDLRDKSDEAGALGRSMAETKQEERIEAEADRIGEMSTEVGLIALDITDSIMEDSQSDLENAVHIHLLRHVVDVLIEIMRAKSSIRLLKHLFQVMQTFVCQFSKILFGGDGNSKGRPEICAQFCEETMKLCSSHVQEIRELASAFLYLMMRQNFRTKKNKEFARVKVQVTIGLSKVVSLSSKQAGVESFMKKSLATIINFSREDKRIVKDMAKLTFPEDVSNLVMNLYTILADTSQIREFEKDRSDPDQNMSIELHFRIAESYKTSPRIRIEWLDTLSQIHDGCKQFAEAGFCMVHSAAIVAEKLMDINRENWLPQGCKGLEMLSKNVIEESLTGALHQKNVDEDDEGTFHADKLVDLLTSALAHFQNARMYEYMTDIYKLLVPIYEASRNYAVLQSIYGPTPHGFANKKLMSMSECYAKILEEEKQQKRFFGTFFRIGFYCKEEGLLPVDLHNKEYISREPSLTTLSTLCLKLKSQYENIVDEGIKIEIVQETYDMDAARIATLDSDTIYLQVTHVLPSVDTSKFSREKQRVTLFERSTNVSSFVFETPFTDSGKARGDIASQKLRKTTLQVEKLKSFPYLKKRLQVVKKTQEELSPIEFAIDSIEKKISELEQVVNVNSDEVNIKLLQLKLQGSVSVSVNEGPAKMATVFLGPNSSTDDKKSARKLKQKFVQFLELCSKGLELNKHNIPESQNDYHQSLAAGYTELKNTIEPLVQPPASLDSPNKLISDGRTIEESSTM